MQTTLIYNVIEPRSDDYKIIGEKGFIPVELYMDVFLLYPKGTYIMGPHNYRDINARWHYCDAAHSIYKVLRKMPVPPDPVRGAIHVAELVEVEMLRTNDVLAFHDILYRDFESWNNFY